MVTLREDEHKLFQTDELILDQGPVSEKEVEFKDKNIKLQINITDQF